MEHLWSTYEVLMSPLTLHFSRQMASVELQRKAPAGAESGDSALHGTIVLRPSRTISSQGEVRSGH